MGHQGAQDYGQKVQEEGLGMQKKGGSEDFLESQCSLIKAGVFAVPRGLGLIQRELLNVLTRTDLKYSVDHLYHHPQTKP